MFPVLGNFYLVVAGIFVFLFIFSSKHTPVSQKFFILSIIAGVFLWINRPEWILFIYNIIVNLINQLLMMFS